MSALTCIPHVIDPTSVQFTKWWINNGKPVYVPPWRAWVKPASGSVSAVVVGWAMSQTSIIWNSQACMFQNKDGIP